MDMTFMSAETALIQQAAQDLAGIRSTLDEATAQAAGPMTAVMPAASDEISTAVATLFGDVGQKFHALNAQAAAFHSKFVDLMGSGAMAYSEAELANATATAASDLSGGPIGTGLSAAGADLSGLAAQTSGFVGEKLLETGFIVGTMGQVLDLGGQVLSANGTGLSTVANLGL